MTALILQLSSSRGFGESRRVSQNQESTDVPWWLRSGRKFPAKELTTQVEPQSDRRVLIATVMEERWEVGRDGNEKAS